MESGMGLAYSFVWTKNDNFQYLQYSETDLSNQSLLAGPIDFSKWFNSKGKIPVLSANRTEVTHSTAIGSLTEP